MGNMNFKETFLLAGLVCSLQSMALGVGHLRVMSSVNPSPVDIQEPDFSWQLESDGHDVMQTSYQISVSTDAEGTNVVWTSGTVASEQSVRVVAKGISLQPATRYYWCVTVADNHGNEATSTEAAWFETGLMGSGWGGAQWIKAPNHPFNTSENVHYTLDYDMRLVKASAAVVFAATSSNTYHMWQINCHDNATPTVRHHVYTNGNLTWSDSPFTQFTKAQLIGSTHHYRIEVEGNLVKTSVDGILVDTYADDSGTAVKGDIGMRVDNNTGEEAYYDNIVLTEYDAEGNGSILLQEDFEGLSSAFFYDADVASIDGNRMCHLLSTSGEKRLMQAATEGQAPLFRKEFALVGAIRSAKLFTSGLGVYDVFVNGQRVGHWQPDGTSIYEELKPGWTDYAKRVFYSGHDVTHLLRQGANALGAVVTSGWWQGRVNHGQYGSPELGFLAKLVVTYEDGTTQEVVTDQTWASSLRGALRSGDIYDGEIYDARLESDWSKPGLPMADGWNAVAVNTDFKGSVDAFTGGYVEVLGSHLLHPQHVCIYEGSKATDTDYGQVNTLPTTEGFQPFTLRKGQTAIVDFGQNMVGWVDFKVKGKAGVRMRHRFTEMLNDTGAKSRGNDGPGGSLYLTNLRSAKAQLYYTLSGKADGEQYNPSTSFFGFRYLEITATDDIEVLALEGQPISSSVYDTGTIETSHDDVNRLFSNIMWGQRGNLLSVPTDCPQRDERLGWTADTQVFSRTGLFNADTYSFYRKWMQDMRDGQNAEGAYPGIAPENWGQPFLQPSKTLSLTTVKEEGRIASLMR